ncbi:hypothetical protein [Paenibacillus sp. sgz302251]
MNTLMKKGGEARGYKDVFEDMVGKQGVVLVNSAADAPGIVRIGKLLKK